MKQTRPRARVLPPELNRILSAIFVSPFTGATILRAPCVRFVRTGLAYLRFARGNRGYLAVMFGPEVARVTRRSCKRSANDAFAVLQEMAADAGVIDGTQARRLGTVIWSFARPGDSYRPAPGAVLSR